MKPFRLFFSTGVVTASEIGDKTMLMAICLAARFRRPAPIIWGILVATVLNHCDGGRRGRRARHSSRPKSSAGS
ncbi:MAG: TMEM165/GDT1 family protein [Sutterella wadsworthensis]